MATDFASLPRPALLKRSATDDRVNVWTTEPYTYIDEKLGAIGATAANLAELASTAPGTVRNLVQADAAVTALATTQAATTTALANVGTTVLGATAVSLPPVDTATGTDANKFLKVSGDGTGWYWGDISSRRMRPWNAANSDYVTPPGALAPVAFLKPALSITAVRSVGYPLNTIRVMGTSMIEITLSDGAFSLSDVESIQLIYNGRSDVPVTSYLSIDTKSSLRVISVTGNVLTVRADLRSIPAQAVSGALTSLSITYNAKDYDQSLSGRTVTFAGLTRVTGAIEGGSVEDIAWDTSANLINFVPNNAIWLNGRRPKLGSKNLGLGLQFAMPLYIDPTKQTPVTELSAWMTGFTPNSLRTSDITAMAQNAPNTMGIMMCSSSTSLIWRNNIFFDLDLTRFAVDPATTYSIHIRNLPGPRAQDAVIPDLAGGRYGFDV